MNQTIRRSSAAVGFLLLFSTIGFSSNVKIYAHDREGTALRFVSASVDSELRSISFLVENTGADQINSLTVIGRGFADGKRAGGLLLTLPVRIPPHAFSEIRKSIESDLLGRIDTLVLVTRSDDHQEVDERQSEEFAKSIEPTGRLIGRDSDGLVHATGLPIKPTMGDACCEWCRQQADACGKNILRETCRGQCTSYFNCTYTRAADGSCQQVSCSYNCKPSEQCC